MKALLDFIVDILKVPSVLVGIIALIGLIAQKKPVADIIKGTIKTILGFIVLGGGAGVLLGSLNPLGDIFQQAFNVQGVVPNNEAIVSTALEKYGTATASAWSWHFSRSSPNPLCAILPAAMKSASAISAPSATYWRGWSGVACAANRAPPKK